MLGACAAGKITSIICLHGASNLRNKTASSTWPLIWQCRPRAVARARQWRGRVKTPAPVFTADVPSEEVGTVAERESDWAESKSIELYGDEEFALWDGLDYMERGQEFERIVMPGPGDEVDMKRCSDLAKRAARQT